MDEKEVEEILEKIAECDTYDEAIALKKKLPKEDRSEADEIIGNRCDSPME